MAIFGGSKNWIVYLLIGIPIGIVLFFLARYLSRPAAAGGAPITPSIGRPKPLDVTPKDTPGKYDGAFNYTAK